MAIKVVSCTLVMMHYKCFQTEKLLKTIIKVKNKYCTNSNKVLNYVLYDRSLFNSLS